MSWWKMLPTRFAERLKKDSIGDLSRGGDFGIPDRAGASANGCGASEGARLSRKAIRSG